MNFKIYNIFIFYFLYITFSYSQKVQELSENPTEFNTQLAAWLKEGNPKEVQDIYELFSKSYTTFSPTQFADIRKNTNAIIKKKLPANPFLADYVEAVLGIKDEAKWREFHQTFAPILESADKNELKALLQFLSAFYAKNAIKFSNDNRWEVLNPQYKINYANKELSLVFSKTDLLGFRKRDTVQIGQTTGTFFPLKQQWKGVGGIVTWERVGFPKEVHCQLGNYTLDTKENSYTSDDAQMRYPKFFGEKLIKGKFEDRIIVRSEGSAHNFPKFESNEKALKIDNLGGGIQYVGGFRLQGATLYGYGDKQRKASIVVVNPKTNKPIFRAKSNAFILREGERVFSENAISTILLGQDSIFHPSADVRFDFKKRELTLSRGDAGANRNPFFSSFHQVDIGSNKISWQVGSDSIFFDKKTLGSGGLEKENAFESRNFFSEDAFRSFQGAGDKNPISILRTLVGEDGNTRDVNALTWAASMNARYDVKSIQGLIHTFSEKGFISYDKESEIVWVQDKLVLYGDAARKKADFDALSIMSTTKETNAVMHLSKQNNLLIDGVKFLEFSEKNKVAMKPVGKQLVLKKNRNIDFDGTLFAGLVNMQGKDFHFEYAPYHIKADSVRYFDVFNNSGKKDEKDELIAYAINSRIEHVSGILQIDEADNKSGKKDSPTLPQFTSNAPSYIFYDVDSTLLKIYRRDSFYFKLDPFQLNNLNAYAPSDLQFKGSLISAGIFPNMPQTVSLQEADQSLGFVANLDEKGLPLYKNKGNFAGEIALNNKGFFGKGTVSYLNASVKADDVVFRPKLLTCNANNFALEEQRNPPQIPQVRGADINIRWVPKHDSMYIIPKSGDFSIFKSNSHTLKGNLILTPSGLFGKGLLDWEQASIRSELLLFGAFSMRADSSDLLIRAADTKDKYAFDAKNARSNVDFEKNIGTFKSNTDKFSISMPYNQYMTSMNEFTWQMKENKIDFKADATRPALFLSIHPEQDSLLFEGKTAHYDLANSQLKIEGVPFINAADALIYPADGKVEVAADAVMQTLNNAKIVASKENKNHVINRATVQIKGKKDFTASGFYEFNVGDKKQEIEFSNIIGARIGKGGRNEKNTATRASGEIKEDANFFIDQKTKFQGNITLSSNEKELTFDGFAQLDIDVLPYKTWFSIKSKGDKQDLAMRFNEPKNPQGDPIRCGLFLSKENTHIYPAVMAPLYFRKDRNILETRGMFKYDKAKDEFLFGDSLKLLANIPRGNKMVVNNRNGKVFGEGKFELGQGLNYVKIDAAGKVQTHFIKPEIDSTNADTPIVNGNVEVDLMAGITFPFPEKVLQIMINEITSASFNYKEVELANDAFSNNAIAEFVTDEKTYKEAQEKLARDKFFIGNKNSKHTFFYNKLPMKWDEEYQSFLSKNTKIGLAAINGQKINGNLDCFVEFKMPSNMEDGMYMYIQLPNEGNFYFFAFKKGVMNVCSSNSRFNEAVDALKKGEKMIKMEEGGFYEIALTDVSSAKFFLNRIKSAWK